MISENAVPFSEGPTPKPRPLATLAILLAAVAAISTITRLIPLEPRLQEGTSGAQAVIRDPGTPAIGPRSADVTIVAFGDYQCAPCKLGEAAFEKVVAADGRVRVLYKDWPILGSASRAAARIALAADRQGKYLAVHQALMRSRVRLDPGALSAIAIAAGVDWPRLQAELVSHGDAIDAQLARQSFQAWSLGLQGAPAYLIGPYLVRGALSEGDLRGAIAAARRHPANSPRS